MKVHLSLPLNNNNGKILHITDTHLFAHEEGLLLGINTNASFSAVINEIKRKKYDFDLIVATGDFVQDGSKEAYLRFAHEIKSFSIPCVWLPGNHDVYSNMNLVFTEQSMPEYKAVLLGEKWLIILLNSQVAGQAHGKLSTDELHFLSSILSEHPNRYAMIFLHHHPIMSHCKWLDEHCLKNGDEFAKVIQQHNNIKSIGCGHIHQKIETNWLDCQFFSTPSTCIQFKPDCTEFSLAEDSPGWRIIELTADGKIKTKVHHLSDNIFMPDMTQNGY